MQKYEKYLNSKNDLKRPLGAFIKELWAIYVFFLFGPSLKPCTYAENGIKINSEILDRLHIGKTVDELVKFFKKFKIRKNEISGAKKWKILKLQKWP